MPPARRVSGTKTRPNRRTGRRSRRGSPVGGARTRSSSGTQWATGGADKVVNGVGTGLLGERMDALGQGGEVAVPGLLDLSAQSIDPRTLIGEQASVRGIAVGSLATHRALSALVAAHGLHPVIDVRVPFDRLPDASDALADGALFDKVLIERRLSIRLPTAGPGGTPARHDRAGHRRREGRRRGHCGRARRRCRQRRRQRRARPRQRAAGRRGRHRLRRPGRALAADVSLDADVIRLFAESRQAFGPVRLLVGGARTGGSCGRRAPGRGRRFYDHAWPAGERDRAGPVRSGPVTGR